MDRSSNVALGILGAYLLVNFGKGIWLPGSSGWWFWAIDIFAMLLWPVFLLFAASRLGIGLGAIFFADKGLRRTWGECLFLTIVLLMAIFPTYFISWKVAAWQFPPQGSGINYGAMVPKDGIGKPLVALYLAATAGIFEEIFYRGMFLRACAFLGRYSSTVYVVASSLAFALVHWTASTAAVVSALVFGVLLGVVFLNLRDLRPLVAAHTVFDFYLFGIR